jgi:hypothetical protein
VTASFGAEPAFAVHAPAVKAKPQHFVPDGTPFPNEFRDLPEPAQDESRALAAHLARLPDDQCAIAVQTFSVGLGRGVRGHFVQKGQRLALTDPLVKAHPDFFRTPAMRLDPSGGAL